MAIFGLNTHKVVEVGKLHGLLSGHMIAQAAYEDPNIGTEQAPSYLGYLDNGFILNLDQATGTLVKAEDGSQPVFLHYTEELMTGPVAGYEYFTVEADADGICYPRAIALYVGDEFVTDNFEGELAEDFAPAIVVDGVLTVDDAVQGEALFLVKKDRLPNGKVAAHVLYVGIAA